MPVLSLTALRSAVCAAAAAFDAQALERDDAVHLMREWASIVHAAQAALALVSARVAECGPPPSAGASTAADFVAKQTGTTSNKAKEIIRTGEGLADNAKTREKATAGQLSADQVAAITDALAVDPDAVDDLLDAVDRDSLGALREKCANKKAAKTDLAATERRIHANRCVRRYRDNEGAEHLHAVGTKREMARLDRAMKPIVERIFKRAYAEGRREPHEAYAFDALMVLADGTVSEKGLNIRHLGVLRIDWSALMRGQTEGDETCEIAGLGPIAVATAREMLGESILKLVITKGVDVVNVTHLGRGPNTAQKIALLWQRVVCTRERCGKRIRLENDHIDGYEYRITRHTRLDELEPLCDDDHDLKTQHGWALVEGTGIRPMVPPDDPRHPRHKRPPP